MKTPGANAFRLRVLGGEDQAVRICSTLDRTWKVAPKTDEQIQFDRDALVNIKNISEHRVLLKLKATATCDGSIVVRSSRRGTFTLPYEDIKLWFQPGEVLNVRSSAAQNPRGNGPVGVMA